MIQPGVLVELQVLFEQDHSSTLPCQGYGDTPVQRMREPIDARTIEFALSPRHSPRLPCAVHQRSPYSLQNPTEDPLGRRVFSSTWNIE